jgi:diguanylate cyclase (GGDEF)-like protein
VRGLRVPGVWTRLNFSVKFAAIIALTSVLVAVIPLTLAGNENRNQAMRRATDKAGIVVNLLAGQQRSLASFASGMAEELAAPLSARDAVTVLDTLRRYSQVNTPSDVVGTRGPLATAAVRAGQQVPTDASVVRSLTASLAAGQSVVSGQDHTPWLLASATVSGTGQSVFIARPIDAALISALDGTITTSADPAGIAVVSGGRVASAGGSVVDRPVTQGSVIDRGVGPALVQGAPAQVVDVGGRAVGVDARPLGAGFSVLVSTPVSEVTALWQPIAILLGLIVIAMFFIVVVVQTDLQRPLRRLDRAVAALARDQYDVPVPRIANEEIGRLASSFEEMRRQLRATVTSARARATIATQLNSPQPLETALTEVCVQLREATVADAAFILVNGSEMTDSFAVTEGTVMEADIASLLDGEGPIGTAYRATGGEAVVAGATVESPEAASGLREFCTVPLRMGRNVLGVLGIARVSGAFTSTDAALAASSAEQVALSLERYRFIAMMQRQATTDDLTGLYNHRFLIDYLGQQVALAERLNTPLAILVIDLDHFKLVNDTYGHPVGDAVLSEFARTLVHSIRRADLAARYGGEEFIVVMANTAAADAVHVAEKIRAAAAALRVPIDGGRNHVGISVSIGGAAYPEDTTTSAELLATADAALYDAKHGGRNRVCMAGEANRAEGPSNVTSVIRPRRAAQ